MTYTHFVRLKYGDRINLTSEQYNKMINGMNRNTRFVQIGEDQTHIDLISRFGKHSRPFKIENGILIYEK